MRQKTIKVSYRVRSSNEFELESLIDDFENGMTDMISLYPEDCDTGKMAATYFYGDKEINAYFYDMELCEGINKYSDKAFQELNSIYTCTPEIINVERDVNIIHVEMRVYMPWDNEVIPQPPVMEQKYVSTKGQPEPMIYVCKVVGVKHYMVGEQYEELEKKVQCMEHITLRREPDNPYDNKAIAAYTKENIKIGYIAKEYIPIVNMLMSKNEELDAELSYMDFMASSINIRICSNVCFSIAAESLFQQYTPIEVYRANYVFRKWGGIPEKEESGLFSKTEQTIDFTKFSMLPISIQDRIANIWIERMVKANVENPTNQGLRMSVPLDLSVYGTSWKDLDLNNQPILDLIELESKMVAIYVRMRRSGFGGTPEEFLEEMDINEPNETVMIRMHYIYDNNRL